MKVFTARFFCGTLVVAVGLFSLIVGLFSFLPPANSIIRGFVLVLVGVVAIRFGVKFAKDEIPPASKTAIDALNKAKLLDKPLKK